MLHRGASVGGLLLAGLLVACGTASSSPTPSSPIEIDSRAVEEMDSAEMSAEETDALVDGEGTTPDYNSNPPTSGPFADRHARCGVYRDQIPDHFQVASLHRGTVIINYEPGVVGSTREALESIGRSIGSDVIVAPRPGLPSPVVVTAWTQLMELAAPDTEVIRSFWASFAQSAPVSERCPIEVDAAAEGE